jgi:hypothetical protein
MLLIDPKPQKRYNLSQNRGLIDSTHVEQMLSSSPVIQLMYMLSDGFNKKSIQIDIFSELLFLELKPSSKVDIKKSESWRPMQPSVSVPIRSVCIFSMIRSILKK